MWQDSQSPILRRISSRSVWSRLFIWFAIPFYAVLGFAFDAVRTVTYDAYWVQIGVVTFAAAALMGYLVYRFTPEAVWLSRYSGFFNVGCAMLIGATKNLLVAVWAAAVGLESNVAYLDRFLGGATLGAGLLVFYVMIMGSALEHREVMRGLLAAQNELFEHRRQAPRLVLEQQKALIENTKIMLLPELEKIQKLLKSKPSATAAAQALRSVIQNQVRPLSEAFQNRAIELSQLPTIPQKLGRLRGQIPKTYKFSDSLAPVTSTSWVIIGFAATVYMLYEPLDAVLAVFSGVAFVMPLLAAKLLTRPMRPTPAAINLVLAGLLGLVSAVGSLLIFDEYIHSHHHHKFLNYVSMLIFCVLVMLATSATIAVDSDRKKVEKQLELLNQELSRDMHVFEQRLWQNATRWSYLLHGTVQPKLVASVARLTASKTVSKADAEIVQETLAEIAPLIQKAPEQKISFKAELTSLKKNWNGICAIDIAISDQASKAISKDESAAFVMLEVLKEAVSNAYRHSAASKVTASVHLFDERSLELVFQHNGTPWNNRVLARKGVGLKMFDDLAIQWNVKTEPSTNLTVLRMLIAVSRHA